MTVNSFFIVLINSIAHATVFTGLLYNISYFLTDKRINTALLSISLFIAGVLVNIISEAYFMIAMFTVALIFLIACHFQKWVSLISCAITAALCYVNLLIMTLIFYIFHFPMEQIAEFRSTFSYNFAVSIFYATIAFLEIILIKTLLKKFHPAQYNEETNIWGSFIYVITGGVLFFLVILAICALFTLVADKDTLKDLLMSYDVIFLIQIVFSVIVGVFALFGAIIVYTGLRIVKQKTKELAIKKDKEITSIYKNEIQNMYGEINDFKHDYMKIYSSMSVLISDEKIDELKKYFSEQIVPLQEKILSEKSLSHNLTLIEDSVIQGLVYSYALKARNSSIDFYVIAEENIPSNRKISSLELSRILGILLDNAFEAAQECEKGMVQLGIYVDQGETIYTVKNTCKQNIDIQRLLAGNNSTKGENRGRGLKILKSIIDKNKYVLFNINYSNLLYTATIVIAEESA